MSIKARIMLSSRSTLMMNNAERRINSGAYRRCLSRIGVKLVVLLLSACVKRLFSLRFESTQPCQQQSEMYCVSAT